MKVSISMGIGIVLDISLLCAEGKGMMKEQCNINVIKSILSIPECDVLSLNKIVGTSCSVT